MSLIWCCACKKLKEKKCSRSGLPKEDYDWCRYWEKSKGYGPRIKKDRINLEREKHAI